MSASGHQNVGDWLEATDNQFLDSLGKQLEGNVDIMVISSNEASGAEVEGRISDRLTETGKRANFIVTKGRIQQHNCES